MTREQFIKRLEEVGYKENPQCSGIYKHPQGYQRDIFLLIIDGKFYCTDGFTYKFSKLEQFLVDKGIVQKEEPFDAHEYLLSRGFGMDESFQDRYYKGNFYLKIGSAAVIVSAFKKCIIKVESEIFLSPVNKSNIDKAIALVEFLIELEGD